MREAEAGRRRRVEHPGAGGHRLEQYARPAAVVGQARGGQVDDLDGLGDLLAAAEDVGQDEGGAEAHVVVIRRLERLAQVSLALGLPGGRLGHAELEQDPGPSPGRRRLHQDAAQVARRRLRSAATRGVAGGVGQSRNRPRVGGRLGRQQVLGHALAAVLAHGEQLGRAPVGAHALGRRDLLEDPRAHDRVREGQRAPRPEDAGGDQEVGRRGRLVGADAGEVGGLRELRGLQDRDRLGEADCDGRQAAQAHEHGPAHGPSAEGLDARGLGGRRRHAVLAQRLDELAHEERDAPRRALAGGGEVGVRRTSEAVRDEAPDRAGRERRRSQDARERIGEQEREQRRGRALGLRARGHDEGERQLLQARQQEGQEAQGRRVGPVRVVDGEHQRAVAREVRAQPVEAVQDRERRVGGGGLAAVGARARQPEQPPGHAGRPLQQIVARASGDLGQGGLEELAHDAEGEVALELSPARA